MENRELVEEYPREYEMTQFEKILVAAKRAKDLHTGRRAALVDFRKESYQAIQEINEGRLELIYKEDEPVAALDLDADDGDDEE